jgi:hypothetical protein
MTWNRTQVIAVRTEVLVVVLLRIEGAVFQGKVL